MIADRLSDQVPLGGFDLVTQYRELGWVLTRAAWGQKAPVDTGWQGAPPPTPDELRSWFATGGYNPGLRTGTVSGGLYDVDCDDARLVPLLGQLAPPWALACPAWERAGRPHLLVRLSDPLPYKVFKFEGKTILEIRGDGHQSLVPPATHPSGERYAWIRGPHQPPEVKPAELLAYAEDTVIAFALSQGWTVHSRHDIALAAAGWMARRGVSQDRAERIIAAAAQRAGDEELHDRSRSVSDTYAAIANNKDATGWPTLKLIVPPEVTRLLASVWVHTQVDHEERQGSYLAKDGQLVFQTKERDGGTKDVRLANFDARVVREIAKDDGSGVQRFLAIEALMPDGNRRAVVLSNAEFASLGWVIRDLGAEAVVSAGVATRDRVREAIQLFSKPTQQHVFTHTGWRQIGSEWVFLHAGLADEVTVELDGSLDNYNMSPVEDSRAAVDASLRLLELGTTPALSALWCGTYLAPLAEILTPDLALWLWGPTGSFKSTLAALFLSHFGRFERKNLPCDWSWTENALERRLFLAKDVLTVIDEFAPAADRFESQKQITKGQRIIRAQGNHSGRGRLRPDISERPAQPPRGVLLSTAEMPPPFSASAVARTLALELGKDVINLETLSSSQDESDLLTGAMLHYLGYLSAHMDELRANSSILLKELRQSQANVAHRRTPEMLANLLFAGTLAIHSFEAGNLISEEKANQILERIEADLRCLADLQAQGLMSADPVDRFLDVLREQLAKKAFYCKSRDGGEPPDSLEVGWESFEVADAETQGEVRYRPGRTATCVGWADDTWLYLMPEEIFRLTTRLLSEAQQALGATRDSLQRGLADRGLIECSGGREPRRTRVVTLEGMQHRVLKLRRCALSASGTCDE